MKLLFSIVLSVFILTLSTQSHVTAQEPDTKYLHGDWKFKTDPYSKGETLGWFAAGMCDRDWDLMPVPGNWDLRNEYANYVGKAWYRKKVPANTAWKDKFIRILFDGVN